MLERINVFVGSLVLSLMIVFGAMYAGLGTWNAAGLRYANREHLGYASAAGSHT